MDSFELTQLLQWLYPCWLVALPLVFLARARGRVTSWSALMRRLKKAAAWTLAAWVVWVAVGSYLWLQGRALNGLLPEPLNSLLFWSIGLMPVCVASGRTALTLVERQQAFNHSRTLADLRGLSPEQFEVLVGEIFRLQGNRVRVVGATGDHGIDLEVFPPSGGRWLVQCKRYRGTVGEPVVRDLYGAVAREGASRGYIVTTGGFTQQAVEWTRGLPVILYDGNHLVRLMRAAHSKRSKGPAAWFRQVITRFNRN